jgi:hypothetical protein
MTRTILLFVLALGLCATGAQAGEEQHHDPAAREAEFDDGAFGPDPVYEGAYDADGQQAIYGGKHPNETQRPAVELFRRLYDWGAFREPLNLFGDANPASPQVLVFGDVRSAIAYNDGGPGDRKGLWANRINLDVDLKLTATERIHAFWDPIRQDGRATRYEFGGGDGCGCFEDEYTVDPTTLFFEGDLASMLAGAMGTDRKFDMPIAGGRMPLLFANGIWVEDVFDGFAFTVPARNSRWLGVSNFDVTFFAGFDNVTNPGINPKNMNDDARMYGVTGFFEALQGYFEVGYGYVEDRTGQGLDHSNLAFSFTRRFRNWLSYSTRIIADVGQSPVAGVDKTADGVMFLLETSLITSRPSNLVPYLNLFYGIDRPNPLARENGDGLLKNTGILFETDALSGFPRLDNTGHDAWGGAIGVEWLALDFSYQIVFELATVQPQGGAANVLGAQYGAGVRFQYPLSNALILRMDAMFAIRESQDDLSGVRAELRYKF